MAKKKPTAPAKPNFIDLRQDALRRNNNLIDDVIRPAIKTSYKFVVGRIIGITGIIIVLAIILFVAAHRHSQKIASPVPKAVQQAVSFPVYYPAAHKLPAGYSYDASSFSNGGGAVLLTIHIPQNQQISVTEQALPSAQELQTFYTQRIPLHTDVKTAIGTARVSALNNQSFTSLPTDKTWLLISAPYAIDQKQLKQLLNSFAN